MAQRIETITQHVFAFDPWEIHQIYTALRESGYDDLADEIGGEMDEDCDCADSCSGNVVDDLIQEINRQSKDGRVIIERGL